MLPSFLAALFFALSAACAGRSAQASGTVRANLGRLVVAAVVLGAFAHTAGTGFASASTGWFLLSGVIGMGLGDLGLFAALPLLGSRLTVLVAQCLAAPIAALGEWWWLGTTLTPAQIVWGLVILTGVALALMPGKARPPRVVVKPAGFLFALLAAAGQGLGALVSRKGVSVAEAAGEAVHQASFGINAAYHRILAGLVFTVLWFLGRRLLAGPPDAGAPRHSLRAGAGWIAANGLAGPVIGVGCYQWALATTPGGIVLPIAATTPLFAIPLAYWLEGDVPSRRAVVGSLVAVAGCVALTLAR